MLEYALCIIVFSYDRYMWAYVSQLYYCINIALPSKIISYSDSNQMIGHGFFDMVKTVFCPQDRDALLNINGVPYCEAPQAKR